MAACQQIFEPEPQTSMGFAQNPQSGLEFPLSLVERYAPRTIEDFIGLARPKAAFARLLKTPNMPQPRRR